MTTADQPPVHAILGDAARRWLDDFFNAHYDRLCAYAQQFIEAGSGYEEDIVQETFSDLITKHPHLIATQDSTAVLKYVYKTIRGRTANHRRDTTVDERNRTLDQEAVQSVVGPFPSPLADHTIVAEELSVHLSRAVSQLPERCREIWLLRYEGLSTNEVAAMLGIQPGTVKVQLVKAFKLLRLILAPWLESDVEEISAFLEAYIGGRDA